LKIYQVDSSASLGKLLIS